MNWRLIVSKCPYTWFKSLFGSSNTSTQEGGEAQHLRVEVKRNNETIVDVFLPARSARWLIDLIPNDVITKIREEGIPIDFIQEDLAKREVLYAEKIFTLVEEHREVNVWLE